MSRIPEEALERLKREISLERLAEARGVVLRPHGADRIGLCPFHDDHEPSLVITPSKNLWHCLGACGVGGSVIDWVMKAEGVSFRHAVEILLSDAAPSLAASSTAAKRSTVRKLASPVEREAPDRELLAQVVGFYHETLKQSPEALGYLERRGLRSSEAIERFKLGYSNRTLGLRLPLMNRKAGYEIRTRLQSLGIFRESGHEHFVGSLTIPVFDEHGNVTEIYGRRIRDDLKPGTPSHLYLPGPHRGVWNVEALAASKEIILCEALIDALTFWCAGYRNVTASYGSEGFTLDHLTAFKRYGTEHVLIAYDRDQAGENAAAELAEKLLAEGIACSRIQFPKGMDANEYALKVQPAEASLGVAIRSAEWLGNGARAPRRSSLQPLVAAPVVPAAGAAKENEDGATKEKRVQAPELDEFIVTEGDRRYRVRGLKKNLSYGALRLNVLVMREGICPPSPVSGLFVDTFDLYSSRQRASFEKQAAVELGVEERVVKQDLGAVLRRAEELQQEAITKALEPKVRTVVLSEEEAAEALELLKDPRLLDRILEDFTRCGIVGEETNKLTAYLAAVSRKLDRPLAVILQSASAAGKSSLMEAVLAFVPEEEREKFSALTGMSLFYFKEEKTLKHKVLAVVEEEGAERATYALKMLQSEGELTIASTGKDPTTGRLVTQEYRVEGPVAIFLTTTAISIDEELLNRCLVLTVDEDREQTRAIHELQRKSETIEGLLAVSERDKIVRRHRNAQRLLRPLLVANPFAEKLTFLDDRTRTRRDHVKYLTLIRAIALLHQYQRPIRSVTRNGTTLEYVEVELSDIAIANRLAAEVLGQSLDELPPQTRKLLDLVHTMVETECERLKVRQSDFRFSRRDVRASTAWSDFQVRVHLDRLVSLEYVLVHHGGRGQSFVYELLYDGEGRRGEPFLMGLLDVEALEATTTTRTSRGGNGQFEGPLSPHRGAFEGGSSPHLEIEKPAPDAAPLTVAPFLPEETTTREDSEKTESYAYAGDGDRLRGNHRGF
jgi:DNA primase catalytic core